MLSEISQRQKSYDFTHMRTLRHKTDEHKGMEAKKYIKTERKTNHKRLLNTENKLRVAGGNANWCSHSGKQYGGSSKN